MEMNNMKKIKECISKDTQDIKTHIVVNGVDNGISGYFSGQELIEKYGECECETIEYEKDYGLDEEGRPMIAMRSYLAVYVNQG